MKPWQEWFLLSILASFVGFVGGMMLFGCTNKYVNKEPIAYRLDGKCWNFERVEKKSMNKDLCGAVMITPRVGWMCTREREHKGFHHSHSESACRWVW